uniref:Trafficking protein particle complex subunit 2-like protein n=1 Tax=Paramoeba aestuarina TaxID=180227 RepID=A0A7S4JNM3_9EUKA|mmetsp:Transcript_11975/g.18221  ORF Transcript_11975/g.18221 Transcript_11975/m.18221 type:complete len:131 (+) Transcript_11975:301-693(+)
MILSVAVIGLENNPLYIRNFNTTADELKFHYLIHASLDLVEDRMMATNDTYLGMLYPNEDFKVFGYATATNIKFIVVVDAETLEQTIKAFFEKFRTVYCNTVCNPFYTPGDVLTSRGFELEVSNLVAQCT